MLSERVKKEFEKKHYKIFNHSGVQICEWTKRSLRGEGFCYKQKFYGVDGHRCMQFSPSVAFCNMRCVFCWCSNELFTNKFSSEIDKPEDIVKNLIELRKKLLSGFGGSISDKQRLKEALEPNHFAISLSGEPTLYPKIIELIDYLTERMRTVFLVTNGTNPDVLSKLKPKKNFQLYISMNAPDEKKFKEICKPADKNAWDNFNKSLEKMYNFKGRKVLRMTQIRGFNDSASDIPKYLNLIEKENPDFVEVKAYMSLGGSRERLGEDKMPSFEEIKKFALELSNKSNYKFENEMQNSRIVLLKNRDSKVVDRFE